MSELLAELERHRRARPDAVALLADDGALTRDGLAAGVEAWSRAVAGRRPLVLAALPGGGALTTLTLAAAAADFVVAPLAPKAAPAERAGALERLRPDVVVVPDPEHPLGQEAPAGAAVWVAESGRPRALRGPDAAPQARGGALPKGVVQVQLTSGSTGVPQALLLEAAAWDANAAQSAPFLAGFEGQGVLSTMPQSHAMGGAVVLEHLGVGGAVTIAERFAPGDHARVLREGVAVGLVASPTYLRMMLQVKMLRDLPALRRVVIGSARTDPALAGRVQESLPQASLHVRYGLSEAMGTLARLDLEPGVRLATGGAIGAPLPGVEVSELPPEGGPLRVRTRAAARGRLDGDVVTPLVDDAGWLDTQDLARWSEGGLVLEGRASQMLKPHGHRVDPGEVEAEVGAPAWVTDAVVVGVPDPVVGQRLVAMVEVGAAAPEDPGAALVRRCRAALTHYKVPHRVVVVDAIPRTHAGKPDRRAVERQVR